MRFWWTVLDARGTAPKDIASRLLNYTTTCTLLPTKPFERWVHMVMARYCHANMPIYERNRRRTQRRRVLLAEFADCLAR